MQRRPGWQRAGEEPDYRYSLANERTFLAWVRTALATMAAGVAVLQLVPGDNLSWLRRVLAVLLGLMGTLIAVSVYTRWRRTEQAMRNGEPMPHSSLLPLIAGALTAVGLCVVVLIIAR